MVANNPFWGQQRGCLGFQTRTEPVQGLRPSVLCPCLVPAAGAGVWGPVAGTAGISEQGLLWDLGCGSSYVPAQCLATLDARFASLSRDQ